MDENGLLKIETPRRKWNKCCLFLRKTLQCLVPISLLSFLSYALDFSLFFTYVFHLSALLFTVFSHALERKYMFLVCNGILAFLAKTLSFNSCSLPVSDFDHDASMKSTEELLSESPRMKEVPIENVGLTEEDEEYPTLEGPEAEEEEEACATQECAAVTEGRVEAETRAFSGDTLVRQVGFENEDMPMFSEEDENQEGGPLLEGASAAEEGNGMNNTEELNKKFEEFIRKMKEELRIEAQQLLAAG